MSFQHQPWHWIWDVGRCRGGHAIVGSPVWLDWHGEFVAIDNIQQVVGHTSDTEKVIKRYQNGEGLNNYCIDFMQQGYMIWEDGEFEVKFL